MIKKIAVNVCKYAISFSLLGYLFYIASGNDSFSDLASQPKQWWLLVLAFAVTMVATLIAMARWYVLVRALDLPFSLRDALRLGFLAYMFNFFSFGVVGGDLLKAVTIARRQPKRRPEAMATVFVDRAVGLYGLFLLVSLVTIAVWSFGSDLQAGAVGSSIEQLSRAVLVITAAGGIAIAVVLSPGFTNNPLSRAAARLPMVGGVVERLFGAAAIYRRRIPRLLLALGMSLATHCLSAVSVYLLATGLPGRSPSFAAHFVIVPIATVAAAVPLPGGLGAFEMALDLLYRSATGAAVGMQQGFVVALAFLVIKLLIAAVGIGLYLVSRRSIAELIREAPRDELQDGAVESPMPTPPVRPQPALAGAATHGFADTPADVPAAKRVA